MNKILGTVIAAAIAAPVVAGDYVPYEDSLYNFENSEYNYENTEYDFRNSPYNYDNSPYNPNSNSIYDANGKRIGYEVESPSGVRNIFDTNGDRIGYKPARR